MAKLPLDQLKQIFATGRVPTQQEWFNVLDSFVHLDNQAAVDQQVVNTKISAYDTALKARQPDGVVNTLGDVFSAFEGYGDNRMIANELSWTYLPGKPSVINLTWTDQTITTDASSYNPLGSSGTAGSGPAQRWLLSTVGGLTGTFLVVDLKMERQWVPTSSETGHYSDEVVAVKVAITPRINT